MNQPTDAEAAHRRWGPTGLARRLVRAGRAAQARRYRQMLARMGAPTTDAVAAELATLAARVESLAADHDAVAKDLDGLHDWIDDYLASLSSSGDHELVRTSRELRSEVRALERRMRELIRNRPADGDDRGADAPGGVSLHDLVDYDAFERRFRGDPDDVAAAQVAHYGALLEQAQPVVDIGCGRGDLLAALAEVGIRGVGVEPNPDMAALARARGVEVAEATAAAYLRSCDAHSLGAIVSLQVVEHLDIGELVELLDLAAEKLRPGGTFIAETPNPASWVVMHTSFILDPTHVWPLNPALLSFLCERAGFTDVRVEYFAPAETMHLPLVDDPDAPPWVATVNGALAQLNSVLFGPQDYAVIARMPASEGAAVG